MKLAMSALTISIAFISNAQSVHIPGVDLPKGKINDSTTLVLHSTIQYPEKNTFDLLGPIIKVSHNSDYARGYNDGAVWKGEGLTTEFHAGVMFKRGNFSFTFHPVIFYSQNQSWGYPDSLGMNPYAYPYSSQIDWVHRYGGKPFTQFHPGQSELKFEIGKFTASMGTQNYSLGPAVFNPILMSTQAGGFPHLKIGVKPTYLTKKQNIAKVQGYLMYGFLQESDYHDNNAENDTRYFNGVFLAISPAIVPRLTLGFNRVLYKGTDLFKTRDILSPIINLDDGIVKGDTFPNDTFDQMASFTINWNFPEVGFRAYLEFAKNDFTSDGAGLRPALVEPDHTRAYTAGFEKTIFTKETSELSMIYEHTNLSIGHIGWRPTPTYYSHGINRQGYTQDGQIIGAGIGPGGNSDNLGLKYSKKNVSMFFLLQRIEHDRDYFVNKIRNSNLHDMEYTASLSGQLKLEKFDLFLEGSLSKNYSKYFTYEDIGNVGLSIGGKFKL